MLRLDEAEDLYQDAFLEVYKNFNKGSVRENTSWENYVITIGVNLASHRMRKIGITDSIDEEEQRLRSTSFRELNLQLVSKLSYRDTTDVLNRVLHREEYDSVKTSTLEDWVESFGESL